MNAETDSVTQVMSFEPEMGQDADFHQIDRNDLTPIHEMQDETTEQNILKKRSFTNAERAAASPAASDKFKSDSKLILTDPSKLGSDRN